MDFFLRASRGRCNRLGFLGGENSADYPLVWRAMLQGQAVRHVFSPQNGGIDSWPCMVYVAKGVLEHLPNKGTQWLALDDYNTWERNGAYEYHRSTTECWSTEGSLLDGIKPLHDVSVARGKEKTILAAIGDDPQVLLPPISCGKATSGVLHVTMESPGATKVQLFFRTRATPIFSGTNSRIKRIYPGGNELFFLLPMDELRGAIRFDPGLAPGEYVVSAMGCRAVMPDGS